MQQEIITIVSGLPRSGTSMMMKILESGGLDPLTDGIRSADDDNPKGYFEFERVKKLKQDKSWLSNARGKVVKVISALLNELPSDYHYKIIFLHRKMDEILASQKKMLQRRGEPTDKVPDEIMAAEFEKHVHQVQKWLEEQPNIDVLYLTYHEVVESPLENIRKVNTFLGNSLDESKMMTAVDNSLYRNRA
ncbi:MAG TPA: sulfotransferase family protein [bacterium]|nr:sulfotransferase family protein [bacterium]